MSDKKPTKRRGRKVPAQTAAVSPADMRRAMEKSLQDVGKLLQQQEFGSIDEVNAYLQNMLTAGGGQLPSMAPASALERAQELMYEAWEASGSRRIKLARQALEISPDCADAYVLLAEMARTPKEAKDLYAQGVQAGERALGPQTFEEHAGHFWGLIETRPYMRARAGLAQCLWMLGDRSQAIAHYTDLLRLNPGDNQGIRYVLAHCLLQAGEDAALGKLLDQFTDDAMAEWAYTRALWRFRREGACAGAKATLKKALQTNRFVPPYLLGRRKLPRQLPGYIGFGDDNEAVSYAVDALADWRGTPGALEWLAANLSE